jgi:hypothetical protein
VLLSFGDWHEGQRYGLACMVTLAKVPRAAWMRSLRGLNAALGSIETQREGGPGPLGHPPLFIVGAPRCGSTLVYQLLVQGFAVGYLSNLHCRLYGAPSLVERALRQRQPPPATFESVHGRTAGERAPSECGEYWYRFFRRRPQYVPLAEADPERMRRLRASVRALGDAAGAPLVFKNLICSLRLAPLGDALPEALFVFVRRDRVANAASLLAARKRIFGDYGHWWSAEPPGIEELRTLPPHEQVVEQVRRVEELVRTDGERLGAGRLLEVRYEAVCEDPRGVLEAIGRFASRAGIQLARRREVPLRFDPRDPAPPEGALRQRLLAYVEATSASET